MVYKHLFRSTPVTIHAPGATHRESNRSYSSNGGERYHKPRRGINRNCCQEPYEMARHKCISLLLVSKGVSSEATPIFLSETPFIMDACRLLNNLKYTPRYVPRIQHLVLASGSLSFMHMTAVARNRFAACVPLQSLTVQNSSFVPRQKRGIETNPVMALTWLDIPLELRLITYRLFFECRSSYPITGIQDKRVECFMDDVYTPDTNQTSHLLNIMLACKQVHAEIKALLHQEATLLVEYSSLCSAREASSLRDLNTFGNLLFTSIYPRRFASFERALCRQLDGRRALQTLRLEVHKYVSGPLNKGKSPCASSHHCLILTGTSKPRYHPPTWQGILPQIAVLDGSSSFHDRPRDIQRSYS